jgi:conjugative relaxase-like TrwC/TraI family protein
VLSITPISAGAAGVNYLLAGAGCARGANSEERDSNEPEPPAPEPAEAGQRGDGTGVDYLLGSRESDGSVRWWGSGLSDVGVEEGAPVREDDVRAVFGRLEHAHTSDPLGAPPRRYASPEERLARALEAEPEATPERRAEIAWRVRSSQRRAVGYYDLTFSPAKSVSVLYAALAVGGRREDADLVWAAHRAGVEAAMGYLQQEAGYSRAGYHGRAKDGRSVGEYVAARSWAAVEFDHTTSRAGDPQLHTHVALLNRVRCEDDREWRTVDSRGLFHARTAAGAVYERTYEEALQQSLGVEFATRPDGKAREVVSIPPGTRQVFSQRRQEVVEAVETFIADHTARYGRPPAPYEVTVAAQQAALSTRNTKEDISAEEAERSWVGRLDGVLDGVDAARRRLGGDAAPEIWDRGTVIAAAVHRVQSGRATWTHYDLLAALDRELPAHLGLDAAEHHELLEGLAREAESLGAGVVALTPGELVPTPEALRRTSDGRPRFRPHRDERFATLGQLDAEERLLTLTRTGGAPMLAEDARAQAASDLDLLGLDDDQRAAVLGILASPRLADALIGPAGTGKSFTMAALTAAWQEHHGAPVIGVATSQAAANVLAEDGVPAANVARFLQRHESQAPDQWAAEPLPYGSLVVIDESGMSATEQLDRVRAVVTAAHGKIVLTGDDRQLGPVGAGGLLASLARKHPEDAPAEGAEEGPVFRLREARRFQETWEGPASLQLRRGDLSGLQAYDEHGRVRAGHEDDIVQRAMDAYLADTLAGRRSVLIAATNGQAADIAGRLRTELIRLGRVAPDADAPVLRDGNRASVGDLVQTRRNEWMPQQLAGTRERPVVNRDVWIVERRKPDGSLQVALAEVSARDRQVRVVLEPEYVAQHLTLAYASTVHSAQGRTVDTGHALIDPAAARDALYVALTRGRVSNTAWVTTAAEIDDEAHLEPLRADYMAVLVDIVERTVDDRTATEVLRDEIDHHESLLALGTVWSAISSEYRRDRNTDRLLERLGPERTGALVEEPGYKRLLRTMHEVEVQGHEVDALVGAVVAQSELSSARSTSDVLRWRIRQLADERPTSAAAETWQQRTPQGDDVIAGFLGEVAVHMDRRQNALGERAVEAPPELVARHLGEPPEDPTQREDWVRRAGAVGAYRELYEPQRENLGPTPSRENPEARAAWMRAYDALGRPDELRDYHEATDDELRELIVAYEREETWAPDHVADALRETRQRAADYATRAELADAEALVAATDEERIGLEDRAANHRSFAGWQQERAGQLELVHDARARWHEETAKAREKADHARHELVEREVPVAKDEAPPRDWDREIALAGQLHSAQANHPTAEPIPGNDRVRLPVEQQEPGMTPGATDLDRAVERATAALQELDQRHTTRQAREIRDGPLEETTRGERDLEPTES